MQLATLDRGAAMPKKAHSRTPVEAPESVTVTLGTAVGITSAQYAALAELNADENPLDAYYAANDAIPSYVKGSAHYCPHCARDFRPPLSPEEARTLDYIMDYLAEKGRAPTYREIERNALPKVEGEKHSGRTNYSLAMLEAKGYIDRGEGKWRALSVIVTLPLTEPIVFDHPVAIVNPQGWPNYYRYKVKGRKKPYARPLMTGERNREGGRFAPGPIVTDEPIMQ